jgi:hypothetical protein
VGFLRRLLGGGDEAPRDEEPAPDEGGADASEAMTAGPSSPDEAARDVELARDFQAGLSEVQERQLRFQQYAWQPPDEHQGEAPDEDDAEA